MRSSRFIGTTVCYPLSVSEKFSLNRAVRGISEAGLCGVELVAIPKYCEHVRPDRNRAEEVSTVTELLERHHVTARILNVACNLTTEHGVRYLESAMSIAGALGISTIVAGVEETCEPEAEQRFRTLVPHIVSSAEKYDVVLALETHGGLIASGVQGVELVKQLDSPRIKLTYDMANIVYYSGIRPEVDLAEMGDEIGRYIAHVHLKDKANWQRSDYDFPPFGSGILDFRAVLNLLHEGGYEGLFALEVELDGAPGSPQLVDEAIESSLHYLQTIDRSV